jgi:LuxR family quorum sensing-dependent transcriptional regulator
MQVDLTAAECSVLQHAADGRSVPETAVLLTKGEATVKSQLLRARLKLGAANTTNAVAIALRKGLIE